MKLREVVTLLLNHELGSEVVLTAAIMIDNKIVECTNDADFHVFTTEDGRVAIGISGIYDTIHNPETEESTQSENVQLIL